MRLEQSLFFTGTSTVYEDNQRQEVHGCAEVEALLPHGERDA